MDELGGFTEHADGSVTLRYERRYDRPIETVWAALTTPERLADWLGAYIVEPRLGGRFDLFVDRDADAQVSGEIKAWDPPRLLEFTWRSMGEAPTLVCCELTAEGASATRLIFTHRGMERRWIGLVLPGWHTHLERLGRLMVTGQPSPDSMARWRELQAIYLDHYSLKDVMTEPPLPVEKYK